MLKIIVIVLSISLLSCVHNPYSAPLPKPTGTYSKVLTLTQIPPAIEDYPGMATDDQQLQRYATDLNWYLMQQFAYVTTVNRYAKSRKWQPLAIDPLCRVSGIEDVPDLPEFKPDPKLSYEEQLIMHAKEVRQMYRELENLIELRKEALRYNCIY